ncbi:MAG: type I 3-dehydroquinate dehydratase, partial [Thermodesulfobacteriota bacterium]
MQSAPRICVAIGRETIDDALAAADSVSSLADVLEIRLDCLNVPAVSPFMNSLTRPLLFTNRPLWEGGKYEGSEEERLGPLLEAVTENCSYVDLELLAPESSHSQLQNVLKDSDSHLILSHHNFQATPDHGELVGRLAQMREMGADIGKIITMAHS